MLYNQYDFERLNKSIEELPDIQAVETFYKSFCSKHQIAIGSGLEEKIEFNIVDLAKRFDLPIPKLLNFIKLIQQRGYWQFIESAFIVPKIKFTSTPENWNGLTQESKEVLVALYRMYPLAVDGPVRFDRKRLAAMAMLTPSDFDRLLLSFQTKGLIEYQAADNKSAIQFMEPRPANKYVSFPSTFVDAYINAKKERTNAMLAFLKSEECMTTQIAHYFGQTEDQPCGICSECTFNHYPDPMIIEQMLRDGHSFDDIWFDLNCNPDELKN